jgi:hypothetical protein
MQVLKFSSSFSQKNKIEIVPLEHKRDIWGMENIM